MKEQERNKRNNVRVEYLGTVMTLIEACEIAGVSYTRAYRRLCNGFPVDIAMNPNRMRRGGLAALLNTETT